MAIARTGCDRCRTQCIEIDFDLLDLGRGICREESPYHAVIDLVDHLHEEFVGTFLVDEEWLFLVVSFEGHIFSEVGHFLDMLHPELIDGGEIDFALELIKISLVEELLYFLEPLFPELEYLVLYLVEIYALQHNLLFQDIAQAYV